MNDWYMNLMQEVERDCKTVNCIRPFNYLALMDEVERDCVKINLRDFNFMPRRVQYVISGDIAAK